MRSHINLLVISILKKFCLNQTYSRFSLSSTFYPSKNGFHLSFVSSTFCLNTTFPCSYFRTANNQRMGLFWNKRRYNKAGKRPINNENKICASNFSCFINEFIIFSMVAIPINAKNRITNCIIRKTIIFPNVAFFLLKLSQIRFESTAFANC